jgi:hypothetical protein
MYLTQHLQNNLDKIGSSIILATTSDGKSPSDYAFHNPIRERNFRVNFGNTIQEYTVVLFDRTKTRDYEICYLRGKFSSIKRLAKSIQMWIEVEEKVQVIASCFPELETFQFDSYKNPNPLIEARWQYIQNKVFNNAHFENNKEWENRYSKMIAAAKRKKEWETYFPFTSLHLLRFSLDNNLRNTWVELHITPTMNDESGNYHVGVPSTENKQGFTFQKLEEAIDFFDLKLNDYHPIK